MHRTPPLKRPPYSGSFPARGRPSWCSWLFLRVLFEMGVEPLEHAAPEGAVMVEPLLCRFQPCGIEAADMGLAPLGAGDQLGVLQHFEVAGDGGCRDGEGRPDFPDRGLT